MFILPYGFLNGSIGASVFSTFNPLDKSSGIALSGGNLVATGSGSSEHVRSTSSKSSGKWYWEVTGTTIANNPAGGIGTSAASLTSFQGGDSNSIGCFFGSNQIYFTNIQAWAGHTQAGAGTQTYAFDFTNKLFWSKVVGGTWNNDGAADPATGTNGNSFAAIAAGPWYIMCECRVGDVVTLNVGASAFLGSIPSGFSAWG